MRRLLVQIAPLAVLCTLVGCAPSASQLVQMRQEVRPEAAQENFQKLLVYFDRGPEATSPPEAVFEAPWRVEALRTMAFYDHHFDYRQSRPAWHGSLAELLRAEYRSPSTRSGARERHRLRAWAVLLYGAVAPAEEVAYFVEVLAENPLSRDEGYWVSTAALDALSSRVDRLSADPALRQKVLLKIATMSSDLRDGRGGQSYRGDIERFIRFYEFRLKDYVSIVDLLPVGGHRRTDDKTLLEILEWNYQQFKTAAHQDPATGEPTAVYHENVQRLLGLMWSPSAPVRKRVRLILGEYAPVAMFAALSQRMGDKAQPLDEDYVHLASVLPKADAASGVKPPGASASATGFAAARAEAFGLLFGRLGQIGQPQREALYGTLIEYDPVLLAQHLVAVTAMARTEPVQRLQQHLRYLGHLKQAQAVQAQPALVAAVREAIGSCLLRPSLAVRQHAAALLREDPLVVARYCQRVLPRVDEETGEDAAYLVDLYMRCLEALGPPSADAAYPGLVAQALGGDCHAVLGCGIGRPEFEIKGRVALFLQQRDPDLLVSLLAEDLEHQLSRSAEIDLRCFALLGDTTQQLRPSLSQGVFDQAVAVLASAMRPGLEERNLLCCRYLLEMGVPVQPSQVEGLEESVRTLVDAAIFESPEVAVAEGQVQQ